MSNPSTKRLFWSFGISETISKFINSKLIKIKNYKFKPIKLFLKKPAKVIKINKLNLIIKIWKLPL